MIMCGQNVVFVPESSSKDFPYQQSLISGTPTLVSHLYAVPVSLSRFGPVIFFPTKRRWQSAVRETSCRSTESLYWFSMLEWRHKHR